MTPAELKRLVKLLGPKGAVAGLQASNIEPQALFELASKAKIDMRREVSRDEMIDALVKSFSNSPLKSADELMQMSYDELVRYFDEVRASNQDLIRIMEELDYKVSAEDKKHLRRFVARRISETALFSRVATREGDQRRR